MAEVAVIIPAYNAAEFLRECIESILAQTFDDLEVVVVDDGSTDDTPAIARSYPGVMVFSKQNEGLSATRNFGVAHTTAPLLAFVDADDTLPPHAIEWLIRGREEAEISSATFSHTPPADLTEPPRFLTLSAREAIATTLYQRDTLVASACAKLISRRIMEAVPFREGIGFEDLDWFYRAFDSAGYIRHTDAPLYYYRPNPKSFVNTLSLRRLDVLDVTRRMEEWIAGHYPDLLAAARDRRLSANFDILTRLLAAESSLPAELRDGKIAETYDLIRRYRREVILSPASRPKNRAASLLSYLGLGALRAASRLARR